LFAPASERAVILVLHGRVLLWRRPVLAPKIHRIRIEKFRRIGDMLELDLRTPRGRPSPLAVLAGPNGCGKTSVLEAVLLGLGQEALVVRDLEPSEREASWRASVPAGARIELTVSFDDGPEETWVRTQERFSRVKGDGTEETPPQGAVSVSPALLVEYFSSWRAPKLVGPVKPLAPGRRPANNETNRLWRLKQRIADEVTRLGAQRSLGGFTQSKPETWDGAAQPCLAPVPPERRDNDRSRARRCWRRRGPFHRSRREAR